MLTSVLFPACAKRESDATAVQILRLSQRNEPGSLDPARTTLPDEFAVERTLLEGLLVPGANGGEPQPGVATRFEVSADGLTYTFHLRPEARWSDGVPVTAGHFVESYRRLLTPATAAPKAGVFFPVKNARAFVSGTHADFSAVGFRAADARTLVVTLAEPTPRFPHYVASGPWLPVRTDVIAKHGRNWTRPENFVGNGPFRLAEWRPHQRLVVEKNPSWHGAAGVRLDEIHFLHFDDGDTEERAYRAGQLDATMAVPSSKVDTYARERPAELHRAPMIETRYLAFNTRRAPLTDARVRRALALAIDREQIAARVLRGQQTAATRLIPAALDAGPAPAAAHRHDPAVARALLAEAGFGGGKNFPRLEVAAWSKSQVATLEAIQAMWRNELGLEIAIITREGGVHLSSLAAGDYAIGFITQIPDVADAAEMLGDFATGAPENYPHWSDPAFDAALARARPLADPAARTAALRTAEDRLLAEAPLTPLYFNTKIWLMAPRVRGWQEDGLWSRTYHQVSLEAK
ncbi:MAG: peptide ABC transporter substrate-binding protein [Opitutaceae bacterium]|nr:peptide ABC transporter substrate-binding protein [Opitutaceae bacterium]